MSENKKMFDQFPPVSTGEWMEKVKADLKGADFDKRLVWKSREGLIVMPFYRAEDTDSLMHTGFLPGEFPFIRGNGKVNNEWYIRQNIDVADIEEANSKVLDILNRGVNSIGFMIGTDFEYSEQNLSKLLDAVFIGSIELNFCPEGGALELLMGLKEVFKKRGIKPSGVKGAIETDPLGRYMVNGKLCVSLEEGFAYLKKLADEAVEYENFRIIRVNGANFTNAGSTIVQELGMSLSMGNEYMTRLTDAGIKPDHAARSIGFTFGIGSNYFMEIARLRAARLLWSVIVKRYGVRSEDSMKMDIHCITSEWNKTLYDPYVNMLRTQTEAMSATLGGTDSLTVSLFDSSSGESGSFSERNARNQQLLLKEESHFDKVADPSAGSYYIENLTAGIAEHAWNLFVGIEEKGGFVSALKSGYIQDSVSQAAALRDIEVSKGREKLLGTNIFPDPDEKLATNLASVGSQGDSEDYEVKPLRIYRGAEVFEKLRLATDRSSKQPAVFLFTIGDLSMRKARARFSSNFFSVAGYKVIDSNGFEDVTSGIEEAERTQAEIVVICSSDDEYTLYGPEIYNRLKERAIIVVAGNPVSEPMLREAGIEHFISLRSNILDTLRHFNKLLGINQVNDIS
ncbi:MAG: acyl-CoA mutase large subunit family protein [Bacteroidales bacterium]|nr:acyl-CoA mutase large subunit family protein [Bacteroidales bacterium]